MNPAASMIPLPEPLPLPAPVWLLWTLLTLTFALHVVAMNLLLGGAIVTAYARVVHSTRSEARSLVAWFATAAPVLFAATVTFGVAPLLFLQVLYGRLFFVSSVLMAWWWLAVVPALIAAYYAAYVLAFRDRIDRRTATWAHALIVAILLGVGFIYSNNMTMMLRANHFGGMYAASGAGWHLNLSDPTLVPRWLHMMAGAVAVAGLGVAILGVVRASVDQQFGTWARVYGARWAAGATAVNVLVGVWWFAALPAPVMTRFIGGSVLSTAILAVGVLAGLATVAMLIVLSSKNAPPRLAWASAGALLVTIVAMVLARDDLRRAAVVEVGFVPITWVAPQWPIIGLFVVCLVAALATVAWMVWAFVSAAGSESTGKLRQHPTAA